MAAKKTKRSNSKSKRVIVRSYAAGVHYGTLVRRDGGEVELADARRIWQWRGANTLHEISLRGVGPGSKVSERVNRITVLGVIEVIDCTPAAVANLDAAAWS